MTFTIEHQGGCNGLCDGDRHIMVPDPLPPGHLPAPLGEGWTEVGFTTEEPETLAPSRARRKASRSVRCQP